MNTSHSLRKKKTLNHINRILGQINTLKNYVNEDRSCEEIATLSTSISKSFDTLRTRTLEGYILNELMVGKKDERKVKQLNGLLKLFKK